MNSVLLIGEDSFTVSVAAQVRGLDSFAVTSVASAKEANPILLKSAPDVVIVQADALTDGAVSKTFLLERANTYIIVIESAFLSGVELGLSTYPASELYLEKTALALESGADAYLWFPSECLSAELDEMPRNLDHRAASASQLPASQLPASQLPASQPQKHQNPQAMEGRQLKVRTEIAERQPLALKPNQSRLIQAHVQIGLNQAQQYRNLSRINDWLSAIALVDALTQLNNRRSFDMELPHKVKVARANCTPFSLMVIDIDSFKLINDGYGHLVGDDVLKMLARRLLANMRFYDTPFRYGGEEFVVTLSNTDLAEGIMIAQRLRQAIARTPFDISSSLSNVGSLALTVSIGLTELRDDDDAQGRSCLNRADQLLLQAKSQGRNQVVSA